ncbi:MAG: MogA/MoaB family molybdenum cofactor biosynthesis protein [Promethearchaeota archaeon]
MKVYDEHKRKGPSDIKVALIIVSTTRFQELRECRESTDKTIPLVKETLQQHHKISLLRTAIVSDDPLQITNILHEYIENNKLHAIIFSGGTGLSPKDITYETITPLFEKTIDGFGELFRFLSYKDIGTSAMLSRATAGKIKDKIIFLLPGSPKAVQLALHQLIIPELKHILYIINKKE